MSSRAGHRPASPLLEEARGESLRRTSAGRQREEATPVVFGKFRSATASSGNDCRRRARCGTTQVGSRGRPAPVGVTRDGGVYPAPNHWSMWPSSAAADGSIAARSARSLTPVDSPDLEPGRRAGRAGCGTAEVSPEGVMALQVSTRASCLSELDADDGSGHEFLDLDACGLNNHRGPAAWPVARCWTSDVR